MIGGSGSRNTGEEGGVAPIGVLVVLGVLAWSMVLCGAPEVWWYGEEGNNDGHRLEEEEVIEVAQGRL